MAAVSSNCDSRYAGVLKSSHINTQHIAASSLHLTKSVSEEYENSLLLTQRYFHGHVCSDIVKFLFGEGKLRGKILYKTNIHLVDF